MESEWTKEEISDYQRNYKRENLGQAYLSAGILSNEPHKRVKYLKEKLNNLEIYEKILKLAERNEKSDVLIKLESLVMAKFF